MPRPRRAIAAALLAAVSLGACTGGGDASQGSVRDDVRSALLAAGESQAVAGDVADCVARGLFEGDFTKEERNEVARSVDSDVPSAALQGRVEDLFDDCRAEAASGESQTSDDAADEDENP